MQILDILGGAGTANLARTFNIEPKQAEAALDALVPALSDRIERNTLSRGGLADLVATLGHGDWQAYIDNPKTLGTPEMLADGNGILEQILGSKDMSRKVAQRAARDTGLSETLLKSLLPAIAAMIMGGLAKGTGGALGEILTKLGGAGENPLPGESPFGGASGPSRDYAPASPRTAAPRPSLPRGQSPLPIPGDDLPGLGRGRGGMSGGRNPLDDLSDIIRRGGRGGGIELPRSPGGIEIPGGGGGRPIDLPSGADGSLWNIIRSILGSVLGFEGKGFFGWLIRLIVLKWGVGILKRVLGRVLTGR